MTMRRSLGSAAFSGFIVPDQVRMCMMGCNHRHQVGTSQWNGSKAFLQLEVVSFLKGGNRLPRCEAPEQLGLETAADLRNAWINT